MATTEVASLIPQRRPRSPHEVIDVDSFDDDIELVGSRRNQSSSSIPDDEGFSYTGFMLPNTRRRRLNDNSGAGPSSAIILDSDDEASASNPARSIRRRLISPPPPVAGSSSAPPVPPLPPHLASHSSFPMPRRPAPRPLPPSIRPNPQPFAFEADIRLPATPPPILPPTGAPRSHHQPSMGLGGGLIALHRQRAQAQAREAEGRRLPHWLSRSTFFDIVHGITGYGAAAAEEQRWFDEEPPEGGGGGIDDGEGFSPFAWFNVWARAPSPRAAPPPSGPDARPYRPEYTHPGRPGVGFTYDFAVPDSSSASGSSSPTIIVVDDDEAGPSGSAESSSSATAVETTLVCARCLDPLVTGPMGEAEAKKARIWVLRCGHMLDGKCIHELMRPVTPTPVADLDGVRDIKGKGKARAGTSVDTVLADRARDIMGMGRARGDLVDPLAAQSSVRDPKGKGKAVDPSVAVPPPAPASPDNSIRSRLRSRPAHAHPERPTRPLPRPRITHPQGQGPKQKQKKGKGRARKPVVECEYEWMCPVSGCGRVHVSQRVDGEWRMDEGRGAVAAFL